MRFFLPSSRVSSHRFSIDRVNFLVYYMTVKAASQNGKVHVYTGCGKGKTSAALGLALRALGHQKKVLLIQFLKKGANFGEIKAAKRFRNLTVFQAGRKGWVTQGKINPEDKHLAEHGLIFAQQQINAEKYDLIILDELNIAIHLGLIQPQRIKRMLQNRPKDIELIITGRYAHPQILAVADLVSEIKEIKHYYRKGLAARAGIEY